MSKKKFSDVVRQWMKSQGISHERLAARIGVGRTSLIHYIEENQWPRDCVPQLAEALSLPPTIRDSSALEAAYEIAAWKRERLKVAVPYDYQCTLAAIDLEHSRCTPSLERIGSLTRNLLGHTNERHFLVSSTSGASMLLLERSSAGSEQRENRFKGMDNGLLWAFVSPAQSYLDRIKKDYLVDFGLAGSITSGFDRLRNEYVKHLSEREIKRAEETADARMQRFECDDFPFTPVHWTTSLLGECPEKSSKIYRAIVRSPYLPTHSYQIFPGGNQPFEFDLLRYFRNIINKAYVSITERGENLDPAGRRRKNFCENLLDRMAS